MDYTYFFCEEENNKWEYSDFYCSNSNEQPECIDVLDVLFVDEFIKSRGYPLKGRRCAYGVHLINNRLYVDLLLTDNYFAHVYCECNKDFSYKANGDIIFPTGWTTEKRNRALLKGS